MSDPTAPAAQAIDPPHAADLRRRAASRLTGAAAAKGDAARAVEALRVLHALASAPATAPDALALLHELQVHQVELDLQAQELHDSRDELESALRRQAARHDALPVGCFGVDTRGTVLELNHTGAALLGLPRDEVAGLPLAAFFGADDARHLLAALADLAGGRRTPVLTLALSLREGGTLPVLVRLGPDPSAAGQCMVVLAGLGAST